MPLTFASLYISKVIEPQSTEPLTGLVRILWICQLQIINRFSTRHFCFLRIFLFAWSWNCSAIIILLFRSGSGIRFKAVQRGLVCCFLFSRGIKSSQHRFRFATLSTLITQLAEFLESLLEVHLLFAINSTVFFWDSPPFCLNTFRDSFIKR